MTCICQLFIWFRISSDLTLYAALMIHVCLLFLLINPLTPNDPYRGRTTPLTSKRHNLYIYSTNIRTEYFKHGIYSTFFPLQNAVCFIILMYLVPVLFTFYIQGVLKLKKNNCGAKRLIIFSINHPNTQNTLMAVTWKWTSQKKVYCLSRRTVCAHKLLQQHNATDKLSCAHTHTHTHTLLQKCYVWQVAQCVWTAMEEPHAVRISCVTGTNPESCVEQHDQILYFEHQSCICTIGLEQRQETESHILFHIYCLG